MITTPIVCFQWEIVTVIEKLLSGPVTILVTRTNEDKSVLQSKFSEFVGATLREGGSAILVFTSTFDATEFARVKKLDRADPSLFTEPRQFEQLLQVAKLHNQTHVMINPVGIDDEEKTYPIFYVLDRLRDMEEWQCKT